MSEDSRTDADDSHHNTERPKHPVLEKWLPLTAAVARFKGIIERPKQSNAQCLEAVPHSWDHPLAHKAFLQVAYPPKMTFRVISQEMPGYIIVYNVPKAR